MMKNIPEEENDYGYPLEFEPDQKNDIDQKEIIEMSKKISINTLKNKGYIDDAFNIMLELNNDIDNNEEI